MDPVGRLTRRRSGEIAPFVFAGVQILKPELFADTPKGAFSTNLIWDRLLESERLYGMRHDGLWFHVGTPASIAEVEERLEVQPAPRRVVTTTPHIQYLGRICIPTPSCSIRGR